jgi:hypothetical protein
MTYLFEENRLLFFNSHVLNHFDLLFINAVTRTKQLLAAVEPFGEYLEVSVDYVPIAVHIHRSVITHYIVSSLRLVAWRVQR